MVLGILMALASAAATPQRVCPTVDMIPAWEAFRAQTQALDGPARAETFARDFAPRFPVYYRRSADPKAIERRAERYFAAETTAPASAITPSQVSAAIAPSQRAFAKAFPDFRCDVDVSIGISLGSFDGQVYRDDQGRDHLLFGADVIATLHTARSLPVLFSHELFHLYHAQQFRGTTWFSDDNQPIWWGLWMEGLATYVSQRLNPGAGLADILWTPRDLDAQVDRRRAEIAGAMLADLDARAGQGNAYGRYFNGGGNDRGYPPRNGYYLGYLFAAHMAKGRTLAELARLDPELVHREARRWLEQVRSTR